MSAQRLRLRLTLAALVYAILAALACALCRS
jgi:hypothetical protein